MVAIKRYYSHLPATYTHTHYSLYTQSRESDIHTQRRSKTKHGIRTDLFEEQFEDLKHKIKVFITKSNLIEQIELDRVKSLLFWFDNYGSKLDSCIIISFFVSDCLERQLQITRYSRESVRN